MVRVDRLVHDTSLHSEFIVPVSACTQTSANLIGNKCAALCEISQLEVNVPAAVCVTADAFGAFCKANRITIPGVDVPNRSELREFRTRVREASFPQLLEEQVRAVSRRLLKSSVSQALAIRSSSREEDSLVAAYAGQFDTFLGATEVELVLQSVKECWLSLWSERAVQYRHSQSRFNLDESAMAVMIQELVPSTISGTILTANPVSCVRDEVIIEASWGLGDLLVGGEVTPDHFLIKLGKDHDSPAIESFTLGSKRKLSKWSIETLQVEVITTSLKLRHSLTLTESRVLRLVELGLVLQVHFGFPQDIEWAIFEDQIYCLQSRPLTTLKSHSDDTTRRLP